MSNSPRHSWTSTLSAALFPSSAPPTTTTAADADELREAAGNLPKRGSHPAELGGGKLVKLVQYYCILTFF